jgi:hypothetical protein
MKTYFAYSLSGNKNKENLKKSLIKLSDVFSKKGRETYITWRDIENWQESGWTREEMAKKALEVIKDSDEIFIFVGSPEKSEGMLIEAGFARGLGKKIILGIRKDLEYKFLRTIADEVVEFEDINNLAKKLENSL